MSGDRFTFATDFIKGRFNLDQLKAIVAKGNIDTPESFKSRSAGDLSGEIRAVGGGSADSGLSHPRGRRRGCQSGRRKGGHGDAAIDGPGHRPDVSSFVARSRSGAHVRFLAYDVSEIRGRV
jgi:hypothetical protein